MSSIHVLTLLVIERMCSVMNYQPSMSHHPSRTVFVPSWHHPNRNVYIAFLHINQTTTHVYHHVRLSKPQRMRATMTDHSKHDACVSPLQNTQSTAHACHHNRSSKPWRMCVTMTVHTKPQRICDHDSSPKPQRMCDHDRTSKPQRMRATITDHSNHGARVSPWQNTQSTAHVCDHDRSSRPRRMCVTITVHPNHNVCVTITYHPNYNACLPPWHITKPLFVFVLSWLPIKQQRMSVSITHPSNHIIVCALPSLISQQTVFIVHQTVILYIPTVHILHCTEWYNVRVVLCLGMIFIRFKPLWI